MNLPIENGFGNSCPNEDGFYLPGLLRSGGRLLQVTGFIRRLLIKPGVTTGVAAIIGFLSLGTMPIHAQTGTFDSITVTGTATINEIDLSGLLNIQGDSVVFGAWAGDPSEPGVVFNYSDGTGGTEASFTNILTRPAASWGWLRLDGSSSSPVMELNACNQLVLTGTQSSSPGSIVIDPTAGSITVNGQEVLINGTDGGIDWDSSGDFTAEGSGSFNNGNTYFGTNFPNDIISTNYTDPVGLSSSLMIYNSHPSDNSSVLSLQGTSGPYGQTTFLRMFNTDYDNNPWQIQEYGYDGHFAIDFGGAGDSFVLNPDFSGSLDGGYITWDSSGDLTAYGSASFADGRTLVNNTAADGSIMNLDLQGVSQASIGGQYAGLLRLQSGSGYGDIAFECYADDNQGAAGFQAYNRDTGTAFTMRQVANNYTWVTNTDLNGLFQTMSLDKNGNATISGTDNELPNQILTGTGSILTEGLGDARYLSGTGPVGIGTSSPVGQFSVNSPDSGDWSEGPVSWSSAYSLFGPGSSNPNGAALGLSYSTTNDMANIVALAPGVAWKPLRIAASEIDFAASVTGVTDMVLNSSGYLGIGTTSPAGMLEVDDNGTIGGDNSTVEIRQPSTASGNYNASLGFYNSNGLTANLSVLGTGYLSGSIGEANDFVLLGGQENPTTNMLFFTNSSGSIKFGTGGYNSSNERMRITPSGNVGINVTNPHATLEVTGTAQFNGMVSLSGTAVTSGTITTIVSTGSNVFLIPQQGDLSMGTFTAGTQPPTAP